MSRHRDEHLDLCAAQVLGILDESGRLELEAHLSRGCPTCEAELRALSAGATVLAMSAPQHRAPAAARDRLLEAVRNEGVAKTAPGPLPYVLPAPSADALPRRARSAPAVWAWAAAAVVLAVAGVFAWRRGDELSAALPR